MLPTDAVFSTWGSFFIKKSPNHKMLVKVKELYGHHFFFSEFRLLKLKKNKSICFPSSRSLLFFNCHLAIFSVFEQ